MVAELDPDSLCEAAGNSQSGIEHAQNHRVASLDEFQPAPGADAHRHEPAHVVAVGLNVVYDRAGLCGKLIKGDGPRRRVGDTRV